MIRSLVRSGARVATQERLFVRHITIVKKKVPPKSHTGLSPQDAIAELLKQRDERKKPRNFDETFDISLKLGLDPRKPNQSIKTNIELPHGSGKKVKVVLFATGEKAEEGKAAGAEVVGGEELVKGIVKGDVPIDFNRAVATPEAMAFLGPAARMLGPRKLMPNAKAGTVTDNVADAVKAAKRGDAPVRTDRFGIIHAGIGKMSYTTEQLEENIRAFLIAVADAKPSGARGKFMQQCHISSTMSKSVQIDIRSCDPTNIFFMTTPRVAQ